jgi:galactokinase/mevalonate kinase-like predicted kinase
LDEKTLAWIEQHLYLVPLGPRPAGFDVFKDRSITPAKVRALATAADGCWKAIQQMNLEKFGRQFRASYEAQIAMFPHMTNSSINEMIREYAGKSLGWKLSGAGGGGYLVLVCREPVPEAIQLKVRRKNV